MTPTAVVDARELAELARVETLLAGRGHASVGGLWGSSQALVLAQLVARSGTGDGPWLAVASTDAEAEAFADDLRAFGADPTLFPARESFAGGGAVHAAAEGVRARLQTAQRLIRGGGDAPRLVVTSILALLQPVPAVRDLEKEFLRLAVGEVLDAERFLRHLVDVGYQRQPLAESPGEVSLRGDILDVFPFASECPLRIELYEDEIESLRSFDPADQRSVESFQRIELCLASDAGADESDGASLERLLGEGATVVEIEPLRVDERAEALRIQLPAHERALRRLRADLAGRRRLALQSLPGDDLSIDTRSVAALEVGMRKAAEALRKATLDGTRVVVLCQTEPEAHRLGEEVAEQGGAEGWETRLGSVSKGFRVPTLGIAIVNHRELKGIAGVRRRAPPRPHHRVKAIESFFELKAGDLVVHAVHGLARFVGLKRMQRGSGGEEEHLHLLFADEVSLYVPTSRVDVVQRYIGTGSSSASLDRIGSSSFRKRKERVERGLFDLAAELIQIQAERALHERSSWRADDELVRDLVGSFPYEDTEDQARADAELEADLHGTRPMDRLICGDVGFGKTELAVRAAFRVVNGGGQVAVLVPTTVLAQQHFETFAERLADYPVEVAMVSRYVSAAESKATLARVAKGEVDVLIGTHRILSKDVSFARLGLVIVDEEQRFGVQHKEHFKKLRATVDVLTLTATPIPRTLHMSLSGIRDISALNVAPEGRQEIETILAYSDDEGELRQALLRELNRGGQAFFLHNRVSSIEAVAARLATLVPSATLAIGHGQMGARELHGVMDAFTHGEADVLVATTIIENGLDIPTANTILIDDADHFGLSELHQLRGRVGRGSHKAYCYLLVERHKPLRDVARQRLKALEELNHLGAGFGISVKDLELRGAGNVLGAEQSGHIAAVGYDMYCRLLARTVERLRAGEPFDPDERRSEESEGGVELELGLRAFLPEGWVESPDARLELARELARIGGEEDAARAREMLRDRYGRLPEEAENLVRTFLVRARLDGHGLRRVAWHGDVYLIQYDDRVALERLFAGAEVRPRPIKSGLAHLSIPAGRGTAEEALAWLEVLLKPCDAGSRMALAPDGPR